MTPRDFSLAYLDTIEGCLRIGRRVDSRSGEVLPVGGEWSADSVDDLDKQLTQLFEAEASEVPALIRGQGFLASGCRSGKAIGFHFGYIYEDPITLVGKSLITTDVIVFQDLIHRIIRGQIRQFPKDGQPDNFIDILRGTLRLRPLVEKGWLYFVPWLYDWNEPLRVHVDSAVPLEGASKTLDRLVMNGLLAGGVLGAGPFTTAPRYLAHAERLISELSSEIQSDRVARYQRRCVELSELMAKDLSFAFVNNAVPDDIALIVDEYGGFRESLRDYFFDAVQIDDDQMWRVAVSERLGNLSEAVRRAEKSVRDRRTRAGCAAIGAATMAMSSLCLDGSESLRMALTASGAFTCMQALCELGKELLGHRDVYPIHVLGMLAIRNKMSERRHGSTSQSN